MSAMVEISIRRFFTCEEADITPRIVAVVPLQSLTDAKTDWIGLAGEVAEQMANLPFDGVREMTPSEVSNYRACEGDE